MQYVVVSNLFTTTLESNCTLCANLSIATFTFTSVVLVHFTIQEVW
jgi:hypothetical protein